MAPYQVYPEDDDEILGSSILHVSKTILLSWFRWRIFVYCTDRAVSGMGVTAWIRHKQVAWVLGGVGELHKMLVFSDVHPPESVTI